MPRVCAQEVEDEAFPTGHLRQPEPSEEGRGTQRLEQVPKSSWFLYYCTEFFHT